MQIKDETGQSILHVAVDAMNSSAVKSLVDLNIADKLINSTDDYKMTPMHIAAINFDVEIFTTLVSLKPDNQLKDNSDKTFLDYLKENEDIDKEILKLIDNININI